MDPAPPWYIKESKCDFWPKKSGFQDQKQCPAPPYVGNIPKKYHFFTASLRKGNNMDMWICASRIELNAIHFIFR